MRIKRMLSCALCVLAVLPSGCKKQTPTSDEVLIHGFESYAAARDYTYEDWFGRVETNTDPQFVTEGSASLKVFPYGDLDKDTSFPFIEIKGAGKDVLTNDFSSFCSISLDVYNPNDSEIKMRMALNVSAGQTAMTAPRSYVVAPHVWTRLDYDLRNGGARYAFGNLEQIVSVNIQFLNKRTFTQPVLPLYIDNLRGRVGACEPYAARGTIGFEDSADVEILDYAFDNSKYPFLAAEGALNFNPLYVTEGESSLQLTIRPDSVDWQAYSGVTFNETTVGRIAYKDGLTFDVYNACMTAQTMRVAYQIGAVRTTERMTLSRGWNTFSTNTDLSSAVSVKVEFPSEYTETNGRRDKVFYIDNFRETREVG